MTSAKSDPTVPRLALNRKEAAKAIGISEESFDRYFRPILPVYRAGSMRLYPVDALRRLLNDGASSPLDDVA